MAVFALALSAYSAYSQHQAGQAAKRDAAAAASREVDAARGEEIERRRELLRSIADRNASAGAGGVATTGSIGALTRTDIRDNRNDLLVSDLNSKTRQRILRSQGRSAAQAGTLGAASSLLDAGMDYYNSRPGQKPNTAGPAGTAAAGRL